VNVVHVNVLIPVGLRPRSCPQIKDEAFDEAEKRFRLQERLIKSFIRDISLYLQHIRVGAFYIWVTCPVSVKKTHTHLIILNSY